MEKEICQNCNGKCKECKIEDCKEMFKMLDRLEKKEYEAKIKAIRAQLPKQCKDCKMLQIIDLDQQKVYCSYMINKCCIK